MANNFPFRMIDLQYKHLGISQTSELQNLLFSIKSENIDEIRSAVLPFLKNSVSAQQFLLSLKNAVTFHPKLLDFCCELLTKISNELKSILNDQFQRKICIMFRTHYKILLTLYEHEIISIYNITDRYLFPFETNINMLKYFYPEITEKVPNYYSKYANVDELNIFLNENENKTAEFKEKRNKSVNENEVCQFIIKDDCEGLKNYLNDHSDVDLNSCVPFSLFEPTCFVQSFTEDGMHFIEYAAFFGSFQVFNFLIENKVSIQPKTIEAAIIGGNSDIIHLLEEKSKIIMKIDYFLVAVNSYQNEIANQIVKKNSSISFSPEILCSIIPSYNLQFIVEVTNYLVSDEYVKKAEKNFLNWPIFVAVEQNFTEIVDFLLSYRKFLNINYRYQDFYKMTLLNKAALSHQIENLKVLLNQKGIDTSLSDSKISKKIFFFYGISF